MNTERFAPLSGKLVWISSIALALTLLICVATPLSHGAQHAAKAAAQNARATPFTLATQVHFYDEPASSYRLSRSITARRADGTQVTLAYDPMLGPDPVQAQMRVIVYPDGRRAEVYDALHAVTHWPADPRHYAFQEKLLLAPPRDCVEQPWDYLAGYTKLGGVRVAIVKEFPRGSSGLTSWRAPELGCEKLQETLTQVQEDGSFRLVTETKFVSLKLGAPDTALFAVPSDYRNLKPSEALRAWAMHAGRKWDADLQAQAEREDARFAHLEQTVKSHP